MEGIAKRIDYLEKKIAKLHKKPVKKWGAKQYNRHFRLMNYREAVSEQIKSSYHNRKELK